MMPLGVSAFGKGGSFDFSRLDEARSALPQPELAEGRAYLDWLMNDHFTFLGCRD